MADAFRQAEEYGQAQTQAEAVISEMIQRLAAIMRYRDADLPYGEMTSFREARELYYEIVISAGDVLGAAKNHRLPNNPAAALEKMEEIIVRLKNEGYYSIGKRIAPAFLSPP